MGDDDILFKGEPVSLQQAIYWIASDGGTKKFEDIEAALRKASAAPSKSDDDFTDRWSPETIAALDNATRELFRAARAHEIMVWGRAGNDQPKPIKPQEFYPFSAVGPLSVASIEQILGDADRYLDVSANSTIEGDRRTLWRELHVSDLELYARWPAKVAIGARPKGRPAMAIDRVVAEMKRDLLAGENLAAMKQAEMQSRYGAARSTCDAARKRILSENKK